MAPATAFRLLISATVVCQLLVCCSQYSYPDVIPLSRQKENNYYIPNTVNMPLLQQKGQFKLNAGFSGSTNNSKHRGVEFQSSLAVTNKFALLINVTSARRVNDDNTGKDKAFIAETGAGYLKKLNANWCMETFGGIGTGSTRNSHVTGLSKVQLTKFFAQPSIGYTNNNQTFQWGIASRFSAINFHVKENSFSATREAYSYDQLHTLEQHPFTLFWEPSMLIRAGGALQVQLQYTNSVNLTQHDLNMDNGRIYLGFCYAISPRNKKQAR